MVEFWVLSFDMFCGIRVLLVELFGVSIKKKDFLVCVYIDVYIFVYFFFKL